MDSFPIQKYATEYCNSSGLVVGTVCEIVDIFNKGVTLRLMIIDTGYFVEVGSVFLKDHFKITYREKNLDNLLR